MNLEEIKEQIRRTAELNISSMLKDLIESHKGEAERLVRLDGYYRGEGLAIEKKKMPDTCTADNQLKNDFFGEIVDQSAGYLFGSPLTYTVKPEYYAGGADDPAYKEAVAFIDDFRYRNSLPTLDSSTGKKSGICGRGARLAYIANDVDGKSRIRVMNLKPWECIFIYNASTDELQYGVRYYKIQVQQADGSFKERTRVEWYDEKTVTFYLEAEDGEFYVDSSEAAKDHGFTGVPMFEFLGNEEGLGEFEKVVTLIDAYNSGTSNAQDELEEGRLAVLMTRCLSTNPRDPNGQDNFKKRHFDVDENGDAKWLVKDIPVEFIDSQLERLQKNIYKFAKAVDVSSDTFTGSGTSGEARKWLLLALENKCATREQWFRKGLQRMFTVLSTAWKQYMSINLEPLWIDIKFDRNLPAELLTEAQIAQALKGIVSDSTILSLLSFIPDVDGEMEKLKAQQEDSVDLDDVTDDDDAGNDQGGNNGQNDNPAA